MERSTGIPGAPQSRLDPLSRATLARFLIQLAAMGLITLVFGGTAPIDLLIVLTALGGQCNAIMGVLARERFGRGPFNQWDLAMMLFAISLGARLCV